MALVILQPGCYPLGQFDSVDGYMTSFKGGEVCTWAAVDIVGVGSDLAAKDADGSDGYVGTSSKKRPGVRPAYVTTDLPLFLADDGTLGYGTLFGQVVGGTVGQQSTGGAVLGPHTATGSGKITLWDKPGLYAVSLDACDTAATGLKPSNASCTVGKALTFTVTAGNLGLLTPVGSANASGNTVPVGYLAEFQTNGSLVTTPNYLTAAVNSPSGSIGEQVAFAEAIFWYSGANAGQ